MDEGRVKEYMDFLQSIQEKVKSVGNLVSGNEEVTPFAVNRALALYYNTNLELIRVYEEQKVRHLDIQNDFEQWYDEKFEECRDEIINMYENVGGKSVKPAAKEYDTRVKTKYSAEYNRRKKALDVAESRVNYLRKLFEILKRYDTILTTISYNMRSELKSLSIEKRANTDPEKNRVRRGFPSREEIPDSPSDM